MMNLVHLTRVTDCVGLLLLFGFTLARANARMLINAASKRSSAKNAVRTSRSRSLVAGNE